MADHNPATLIARIEELEAAVHRVREVHVAVEIEPSDTICKECSFQLPTGRYFGKIVEYPCPTIQALEDS